MKVLPFLATIGGLIAMAIPAHADSDDDAFLDALTQAGISYQNPDRAVTSANVPSRLLRKSRGEGLRPACHSSQVVLLTRNRSGKPSLSKS